jgi:hypothetical protein
MRAAAAFALLALALLPRSASAHHAPQSFVKFEFRATSVGAEVMLPVSELRFALGAEPQAARLRPYLLAHVAAATPQGARWTVKVVDVEATEYFGQPYLRARLDLVPPARASARDFVFHHDAVTHEVRNHVVWLVAARDHADAALADAPVLLGALQYPTRELPIRRPD